MDKKEAWEAWVLVEEVLQVVLRVPSKVAWGWVWEKVAVCLEQVWLQVVETWAEAWLEVVEEALLRDEGFAELRQVFDQEPRLHIPADWQP